MTRFAGVAVLDADGDGDQDVFATNGPQVKGDRDHRTGAQPVSQAARARRATRASATSRRRRGSRPRARTAPASSPATSTTTATRICSYWATTSPAGCSQTAVTARSATSRVPPAWRGTAAPIPAPRWVTSTATGCSTWSSRRGWTATTSIPASTSTPTAATSRATGSTSTAAGCASRTGAPRSGIQRTRWFHDGDGPRPDLDGLPTITWATAFVDYDLDGDADVVFADDQCNAPLAKYQRLYGDGPIVDRGLLHLFRNDGRGRFTDVSGRLGLDKPGAWMGLAFADFDTNGALDIYATNFGDYSMVPLAPYERGDMASRAFYGQRNGTFADPGADDVKATNFGWGTGALDYDNDGCTDVIYEGGLDEVVMVERSNPGTLLHNRCGADAGKLRPGRQRLRAHERAHPPQPVRSRDRRPRRRRLHRRPVGLELPPAGHRAVAEVLARSTALHPTPAPSFFPRMVPLDPVDADDPRHTPPEHWQPIPLKLEDGDARARTQQRQPQWLDQGPDGRHQGSRRRRQGQPGRHRRGRDRHARGRPAQPSCPSSADPASSRSTSSRSASGLARRAPRRSTSCGPAAGGAHLTGVRSEERLIVPELPCEAGGRGRECRSLTTKSARYQEGSSR